MLTITGLDFLTQLMIRSGSGLTELNWMVTRTGSEVTGRTPIIGVLAQYSGQRAITRGGDFVHAQVQMDTFVKSHNG